MGIDISKLKGVLKLYAKKVDTDKNGILEGSEVSVFKSIAKEAASEEDYKAIFGANFDDTTAPEPKNTDEPKECKYGVLEEGQFTKLKHGNKHSWRSIVDVYYKDCLEKHSYSEIVNELKKVNGINKKDNVIPTKITLPDYLFGEEDSKRLDATEADVFEADKKMRHHQTNRVVQSERGEVKQDVRYYGTKECGDTTTKTKGSYPTAAEALEHAQDDTQY